MERPIVHNEFRLEKYPGKGGWTYAALPGVQPDRSNPFGWVTVKGSIDSHKISKYKLMPMGNGKLFLPVRADIRKKIRKEAGDIVRITLYADTDKIEIPADLRDCLIDEPTAYKRFLKLSESEQLKHIKYVDTAKTDLTRANRISEIINGLTK